MAGGLERSRDRQRLYMDMGIAHLHECRLVSISGKPAQLVLNHFPSIPGHFDCPLERSSKIANNLKGLKPNICDGQKICE
ncbi:hypothetical protein ACLOJK_017112 [Asimina triloba]